MTVSTFTQSPPRKFVQTSVSRAITRPIRVLVVEDNPTDASLIINALGRAGFEPKWTRVFTEQDFITQIDLSPELILSDYVMPQFDGLRALQIARMRKPEIPFILVSGRIGEDVAVEAMRLGADDYLLKDRMARLGPAVLRALEKHALRAKTVHAEKLQHESEERLRLFVEHAPAAIAMLDSNLRYIAVSHRWMTDYSLGDRDIIGLSHYEVFPDIPERWKKIHRRCLAGMVEKSDEDIFPRSGGRIDWESWEIHPWRTVAGEIGGIILFTESITERKLAQIALQESEQRFRAIFNHAGIGITMRSALDRGSPWIQVNDYFCKLLGYTRDELLKLSTTDITPEDQKVSAVIDNKRLLKGEITRYVREKQIIRKDGRRIWVLLTVASLPGPDGRPQNLIATYQDINERKAADEKVWRLSRVRAVLSGTNAAIVRVTSSQELFKEVCRIAVEEGILACAWIGSLNPQTLDITPVTWAGDSTEEMRTFKSTARDAPPQGQGAISRAARERRAIISNNLQLEKLNGPRREAVLKLGFQSMIALPLFEGDTVVGTFTLYARETGYFDADEIALLTQLASNVSFALKHIAQQKKFQKLSRIRSVLGEINAAIVRVHDKQRLFEEACRIAAGAGGFTFVWIGIYEPDTKQVRPVSWAGASDDYLDVARAPRPVGSAAAGGAGLVATALLSQTPVIVNDVQNDPRVVRREMHLQRGTHSIAVLPLFIADQVAGVLALHAEEPGFFDAEEMALLFELASDISFALLTIEKQEKLDYLSYYDSLTGLPNRTLFMDRVGQQMRSRGNEPRMVALILINIERFRYINETFGRGGGDGLLKFVAQRLEHAFYGKDYLARIGADSFGIVMRGIRDSTRILHIIEDQVLGCFREPFTINDEELRAAAKIGVAVFPADGSDADKLYRNAEAALKMARSSGERYLFYASEMNARAAQTLAFESKLRKAVEAREFVLHYQPKYTLADGKICGMEALIRWQNPASGLVPPATFIPLLEETGLILEVGKWALDKALTQHREWTAQGLTVPRIAVNVSAIQLQQKNFADMVIDVLQAQGDNADALELEVTESLLMKNVQDSIRTLSILRGLGITIAMDDFGTGYSSLAYIARLPITSIKIDRSFVTGMTDSSQNMNIVTTIIALAHSMNLKVVAEGVETREQSKILKKLKCDEAQGYIYSKPLPAQDIQAILRAGYAQPPKTT